MNKIIAIQADPLSKINAKSDSTWLLMNEFKRRGYQLFYYTPNNLLQLNGKILAIGNLITIKKYQPMVYEVGKRQTLDLENITAIMIRQNPPLNMEYLTTTYLLERIKHKVLILNNPSQIRNCPEKLFVTNFPQYCPPTIIASSYNNEIKKFIQHHKEVVIKPIYDFGGSYIKKLSYRSKSIKEIIKKYQLKFGNFIIQKFLPSVLNGDKRIILLDGEILGAIKRIPKAGDFRSNLIAGGRAERVEVTKTDLDICRTLRPELKRRGLLIAGIDIIDNFLIEINITSPTGLVAINKLYNRKTEIEVVNAIERKLKDVIKAYG